MLNFPTGPATNDVFTSGGNSWRFDGAKWLPVLSLAGVEGLSAALTARSPGGASGAVQFNGAGSFAGASNVSIDAGNLLVQATSEPAAAASGVKVYAREIVPGNTVLKVLRPSGVDSPLQDGIAFNRIVKYQGGPATIAAIGGGALTASAAGSSVPGASSARLVATLPRTQYLTAVSVNAITSLYTVAATATNNLFRSSTSGFGGFRVVFRWSTVLPTAAQTRYFFGLRDVQTAPNNVNPLTATAPGVIGVAVDLATSNNYQIVSSVTGNAPTVVDAGANFPANTSILDLMELVLFCRPGDGSTVPPVSYRLRRYTTTGAPAFEVQGTISANLPAGGTLLSPAAWVAAGAQAASSGFQINSITLESDF